LERPTRFTHFRACTGSRKRGSYSTSSAHWSSSRARDQRGPSPWAGPAAAGYAALDASVGPPHHAALRRGRDPRGSPRPAL